VPAIRSTDIVENILPAQQSQVNTISQHAYDFLCLVFTNTSASIFTSSFTNMKKLINGTFIEELYIGKTSTHKTGTSTLSAFARFYKRGREQKRWWLFPAIYAMNVEPSLNIPTDG
jgi:hypothetical protein